MVFYIVDSSCVCYVWSNLIKFKSEKKTHTQTLLIHGCTWFYTGPAHIDRSVVEVSAILTNVSNQQWYSEWIEFIESSSPLSRIYSDWAKPKCNLCIACVFSRVHSTLSQSLKSRSAASNLSRSRWQWSADISEMNSDDSIVPSLLGRILITRPLREIANDIHAKRAQ